MYMEPLLGAVATLLLAALFFSWRKCHALTLALITARQENVVLKSRLENEERRSSEKLALYTQTQSDMQQAFKALSSDAMKETQRVFFDLAKSTFETYQCGIEKEMHHKHVALQELVRPLKESLDKVENNIQSLEKSRVAAYAGVTEQLKALAASHLQLQHETGHLAKAMRAPSARGRWGELHLKRVVELAGMLEHCDFFQQVSGSHEELRVRPDLVVKLPNSRHIVVDAKAPLHAYLEAIDHPSEEQKAAKLKEYARNVRKHLADLGEKSYWECFQPAPEFVVLFLPGDAFFHAALEHDPTLIEHGVNKNVLFATPSTLIALLKAVACGWQEERMARHAEEARALGRTLYDRLVVMSEHFAKLKRSLDSSVEAYNKTAASFEGRVLGAARRFQELGVADSKEIPELELIEKQTRSVGIN